MREVWKYQIDLSKCDYIDIGVKDPRVVLFGKGPKCDDHCVHIWIEHGVGVSNIGNKIASPDIVNYKRLRVFGTGHSIPEEYEHVMSTIDGPFVWHLYMAEV